MRTDESVCGRSDDGPRTVARDVHAENFGVTLLEGALRYGEGQASGSANGVFNRAPALTLVASHSNQGGVLNSTD